mgnify:CR=1 FL=1
MVGAQRPAHDRSGTGLRLHGLPAARDRGEPPVTVKNAPCPSTWGSCVPPKHAHSPNGVRRAEGLPAIDESRHVRVAGAQGGPAARRRLWALGHPGSGADRRAVDDFLRGIGDDARRRRYRAHHGRGAPRLDRQCALAH